MERCELGRFCVSHCEICCYDEDGNLWEDHEMFHRYQEDEGDRKIYEETENVSTTA